jgi:hypothetical protein
MREWGHWRGRGDAQEPLRGRIPNRYGIHDQALGQCDDHPMTKEIGHYWTSPLAMCSRSIYAPALPGSSRLTCTTRALRVICQNPYVLAVTQKVDNPDLTRAALGGEAGTDTGGKWPTKGGAIDGAVERTVSCSVESCARACGRADVLGAYVVRRGSQADESQPKGEGALTQRYHGAGEKEGETVPREDSWDQI